VCESCCRLFAAPHPTIDKHTMGNATGSARAVQPVEQSGRVGLGRVWGIAPMGRRRPMGLGGAMGLGRRGTVRPVLTVYTSTRGRASSLMTDRAAGRSSRPGLSCGTQPKGLPRGLVGSTAALDGDGTTSEPGKNTVEEEVLSARGQAEVDSLLTQGCRSHRKLKPLIKAIGEAPELQKLDWLWAWAKKQTVLKLNVSHYNAFITQLGRRGRWGDALEQYAIMKKAKLKPDVITYNALISACGRSKQCERAAKVFEEMKKAGVKPDVRIYNALIGAFESGEQWERAAEVLEEMKAAGVQPDRATSRAA
jgi:pentatricopeptide repeat protein